MKFSTIYFMEEKSFSVKDRVEYKNKWYSVIDVNGDMVTLRDTDKKGGKDLVVNKDDIYTSAMTMPGIEKHGTDFASRQLRSDAGKKRKTKAEKEKEKAEEPEQLSLF